MKIFIISDMECVAGMVNFIDYCLPESKYYKLGKRLTTLEVNAAVEGLLEGGAGDIVVWDGHGPNALECELLHPEVRVATGRPMDYPFFLDDSFDAMIMVGQHAKANVNGGHLCHSGSFNREDWILNRQSIGEIGLNILLAEYFGVPTIMLSGDQAACDEAIDYIPSITTVSVIEGQKRGSASGLTELENKKLNVAALHHPPVKSRQLIKEAATSALTKIKTVERYNVTGPYEMIRLKRKEADKPAMKAVTESDDYLKLLKTAPAYQPI